MFCILAIGHITTENNDTLESSISLIPISEVPFPAIAIDPGPNFEPLALIKKSGDMIREEKLDPDGIVCSETKCYFFSFNMPYFHSNAMVQRSSFS